MDELKAAIGELVNCQNPGPEELGKVGSALCRFFEGRSLLVFGEVDGFATQISLLFGLMTGLILKKDESLENQVKALESMVDQMAKEAKILIRGIESERYMSQTLHLLLKAANEDRDAAQARLVH